MIAGWSVKTAYSDKIPEALNPVAGLVVALLLILLFPLAGEEAAVILNKPDKFFLGLRAEYSLMWPVGEMATLYNVSSFDGAVSFPLPAWPAFQPLLNFGLLQFNGREEAGYQAWSHTHFYGALGMAYTYKFNRFLGITPDVAAGFSIARFPGLFPEQTDIYTRNLIFQAGAQINLNISSYLNISFYPHVKYLYSLSGLMEFNSLLPGLGVTAGVRFGAEPDSAQLPVPGLHIETQTEDALFAAMQSYYLTHPIGYIRIINPDKYPYKNLEIAFFQPGYMDAPTPAGSLAVLEAGMSKEVPIFAAFNQGIFKTEGITPLAGKLSIKYSAQGKSYLYEKSITYELYDKTTVTWDDVRKIAAFITPADKVLRDYVSYIHHSCQASVLPVYNEQLQTALQIYAALESLGLIYQKDPRLPATRQTAAGISIDSISLAKETLQRKAGDCDDLTALYCSLLETAGLETGFISGPGHIYPVFNTKVPAQAFTDLHPEQTMTINYQGELWVPVEITLLSEKGFLDAWRQGSAMYQSLQATASQPVFYTTREAQELYKPVMLLETNFAPDYGDQAGIRKNFQNDLHALADTLVAECELRNQQGSSLLDNNQLGIKYAQFNHLQEAEHAFKRAIAASPEAISPKINLGSVLFLKYDYQSALDIFLQAMTALKTRGLTQSTAYVKLLTNIANCYDKLGQFEQVKKFLSLLEASPQNPSTLSTPSAPEQTTAEAGKAGLGERLGQKILFIKTEELPDEK